MTSQMIANSIIVVGFFSAVAFLFTAAAATALAWFKINSRVEELSGKVDVLDVDLSALTKDFHDFRGVSDDRHARLLALIEEQAAASAEQRDMLVKHGEMITRQGEMISQQGEMITQQGDMLAKHGEMIGQLMTAIKQSPQTGSA